jgi:hypothetical protein
MLSRSEWGTFFDRISRSAVDSRMEIEVASLDLGDQIVAEWLPLVGITYDSKDDLVDVALKDLDHLIRHPKEVHAVETDKGLETVSVVSGDAETQVLRFKVPLALAPAGNAR